MSEPHDFATGSIEFGAMRRWRLKQETRYGEAGLLKQGRRPGPLRRGGNRGQSDDASGSAKYGRWLADVDEDWRSATAPKPGQWQHQDTRQQCWPNQTFGVCAKAFVADAASRSDRTGPLVASGQAGDRLAIYFNRGTLM